MRKRLFGILLSAVLILSAMGFAIPMTAMADSMMVVTVGADLTEEQKNMILRYFNVAGQSYTTIVVTNDDEWRHLGGYMSRDIVGYKTISCALIRPMTSGGIQVKTANLTYVTSNMIASNLATAGVKNCEVLAAAPFQVSGTGALTGALMAYENLSGVTLDNAKKEAAVQEFATTYELGQTIGQQEAQQIVNDMKMQIINGTLEEDNSISYEEITEIVNNVVSNYTNNNTTNNNTTNNTTNSTTNNITNNTGLSQEDITALQNLAVSIAQQSYDKGTIDALAQIQKTLEGQTQTPSTPSTTQIEQAAAPTAEPSASSADTASTDGTLSAADQALAEDSILKNTDEGALKDTAANGELVTSSTSSQTIDKENSVDLDKQIEEQQQASQPEQNLVDDTGIPPATDVSVIGGTDSADNTPADTTTDTTSDIPAGTTTDLTTDATTDLTTDTTTNTTTDPSTDPAADLTADPTADMTTDSSPEGTDDPTAQEGSDALADAATETVTTEDIYNQRVTFRTLSSAENGTKSGLGVNAVEVTLPYENLSPDSGALHVFSENGAEVGTLNINSEAKDTDLMLVPEQGSTRILMVPKDYNDISLTNDFVPVEGEVYTYTLDAQFNMGDGRLAVQIDSYTPYDSNPVSNKGFQVNGACINKSYMEGASGSVIFPADSTSATIEADGGAMLSSDTVMPGDEIMITPMQAGPVTLTITYYSEPSEDGSQQAAGTAQYTIYFS